MYLYKLANYPGLISSNFLIEKIICRIKSRQLKNSSSFSFPAKLRKETARFIPLILHRLEKLTTTGATGTLATFFSNFQKGVEENVNVNFWFCIPNRYVEIQQHFFSNFQTETTSIYYNDDSLIRTTPRGLKNRGHATSRKHVHRKNQKKFGANYGS